MGGVTTLDNRIRINNIVYFISSVWTSERLCERYLHGVVSRAVLARPIFRNHKQRIVLRLVGWISRGPLLKKHVRRVAVAGGHPIQ